MNNLQFAIEEDTLYSPLSPDVIDISSNSDSEFIVEPGNVPQLLDRFRVNTTGEDSMTAFMGATTALLFPTGENEMPTQDTIDVRGTRIERELMDLVEEDLPPTPLSLPSFIDSDLELENEPSSNPNPDINIRLNSYGRPAAAILPTPRNAEHQSDAATQIIPTYPPNHHPNSSDFHHWDRSVNNGQNITQNAGQDEGQASVLILPNHNEIQRAPVSNTTPLVVQLPPRGVPDILPRVPVPIHPMVQVGFPFAVAHSTNVLYMPINERDNCRLFPTVMPNVAGICEYCNKTYDQIALETLGDYLAATAYDGETVRDRGVRSRAFIDGFEAALFIFKRAGLFQPYSCTGPVVQQ